jgi:hypothetical protein
MSTSHDVHLAPVAASSLIFYARAVMIAFALVFGLLSVGFLCAEFVRSSIRSLPVTASEAAIAAKQRGNAVAAARFGVVRGELWAEAAYSYANLIWTDARNVNADVVADARTYTGRALTLAPPQAGAWLLLAGLAHLHSVDAAAALKMSYYTGPSEISLIPLRLLLSVGPGAIDDFEIQQFVKRDVRTILVNRLRLQSAIFDAYRAASSRGKQVIEEAASEYAPAIVQSLRAQRPPS